MLLLKRTRIFSVLVLLFGMIFQGFFAYFFEGISYTPVSSASVAISVAGKVVPGGEWTGISSAIPGSKSLSVTVKWIKSTDSRLRFLLGGLPLVAFSDHSNLSVVRYFIGRSPIYPVPILRDWLAVFFSPLSSDALSHSSSLVFSLAAFLMLSCLLFGIIPQWNKSSARYYCSGISPPILA